jgi:hypothetical protein
LIIGEIATVHMRLAMTEGAKFKGFSSLVTIYLSLLSVLVAPISTLWLYGLIRDSSGLMIILVSLRKSGKNNRNKATMQTLKQTATKNASRELA